ncbi:ANTAR domain-containing protein [Arthrobacter crusticola]|uniref:ANTAR domain-containing protein n=2 Tax=Arthrobacter crusticola TaxID=2547960 RepID=A0A4R5TT83_9MICC|nr:ANTAR domain-containing protein [Arthrobacter crusticola]
MDPTGPPSVLRDLVLNSTDVKDYLYDLANLAVHRLSTPDREVFCGITLLRPRTAATVVSSSRHARNLDEIQYAFRDGPCLTAARTSSTVLVEDTRYDGRWPEYQEAARTQKVRSILAVPIPIDGEAQCGLNLYSLGPSAFDPDAVHTAEVFAREASRSLRLAVRIARLTDAGENLRAAMASRTTIDLAVGIIMARNGCSQEAAMIILKAASSARNIKLRDSAARVVASAGQGAGEA